MTDFPWRSVQANISILFTEAPLLERPRLAAAAGFRSIECWWPFDSATPSVSEVEQFAAAVEAADVQLRALNFFAGNMPAGERGIVSHPARRAEFDASVAVAIELGARLGVEAFNALYGNRLVDEDPAEQDAAARDALSSAARAAQAIGAIILLEPVSGVPAYPVKSARDALEIIASLHDHDNIALLADLYHLTVNGDDVEALIAHHIGEIGHVQIADAPGRHEPGTGSRDLTGLVEQLHENGYRGRVGLEYAPSTTTAESLTWLTALAPAIRS